MSDEKYLLWDTRSYVGNCILWWAPNGHGYVTDVDAISNAHRPPSVAERHGKDGKT